MMIWRPGDKREPNDQKRWDDVAGRVALKGTVIMRAQIVAPARFFTGQTVMFLKHEDRFWWMIRINSDAIVAGPFPSLEAANVHLSSNFQLTPTTLIRLPDEG